MIKKYFVSVTLFMGVSLVSGCAIVTSSTSITPLSALDKDLISRSGLSEGPNNTAGNSFTEVLDWAVVGDGTVSIDSSALTLRHAPGVVQPNNGNDDEVQAFSPTDGFSVEGLRDNTNSIRSLQSYSLLGRYSETSGSGASQRFYTAYSTAGFTTPFQDLVTIARAGATARYTGQAALELIEGTGHRDVAVGNADINVDFGANAMTGEIFFGDPLDGGTGFDLTTVNLSIDQGSFVGNSFSGVLSGDIATLGASSLDPIRMTGSVYGPDAAEIGGSFSTSGTAAASGEDIAIIGGFLGKQ